MKRQRLMRIVYRTDYDENEPDYPGGRFSDPFPAEGDGPRDPGRIVAVDWSTPGEVEVTWLVNVP